MGGKAFHEKGLVDGKMCGRHPNVPLQNMPALLTETARYPSCDLLEVNPDLPCSLFLQKAVIGSLGLSGCSSGLDHTMAVQGHKRIEPTSGVLSKGRFAKNGRKEGRPRAEARAAGTGFWGKVVVFEAGKTGIFFLNLWSVHYLKR